MKIRIGVIGCGARADCYLCELKKSFAGQWELVSLADPREDAVNIYKRNYQAPEARYFKSGPEMLKKMCNDIDAVIIASPNSLHLESVLEALERKIIILLEKPVATSPRQCEQMWKAYKEVSCPPLSVGFVLRYTNFYKKIKDILDSGSLGMILSIEAAEMLDPPLTAAYTRGWRRLDSLAGSFLLEKCCHDIDLLNWFADSEPVKVSSLGKRTDFVPRQGAAMHCRQCRFRTSCRYSAELIKPYLINVERKEELEGLIPADNDLCVYNCDKDVYDHQLVIIEYDNDILANFSVCMDQPVTTRTIKIHGTEGQLFGEITQNMITVKYHAGKEDSINIEHDSSGHHGGDSIITDQFKKMLTGQDVPPLAGLREGLVSALVCFGAQQSSISDQTVSLHSLYEQVFI